MDDGASSFDDATDVTHSTAFNVLNTLVDEGQIMEERAEYLKQKFRNLHSRVLAIYKRDNLLLKRARQLRTELDTQRQAIQSRGETARKDDDEIQRLKRTLTEAERELTDVQERESILQVEALEYDRKKQMMILEREDALAAEEARLRPKMESVQAEISDIGEQVKKMVLRYEELQASHRQLLSDEDTCKKEVTSFATTLAHARQQLMNITHDPERAAKQLQLVQNSLTAAQRELEGVEEKVVAQDQIINKLELQKRNEASNVAAAKQNLQNVHAELESKRKTLATLNTSLEVELETRQSFQTRLNELDILIKSTKIAETQEWDSVERIQREKEKCVREFSLIEQEREDTSREAKNLAEAVTLVQREIEAVKASRKETARQMEVSAKDVEARTKQLLKEQSKEKDFTAKAKAVLDEIVSVEEQIAAKTKQEDVKRRELVTISTRRQDLSREAAREAARVALMKSELSAKESHLRELTRRHEQLEKRLSSLIEVFHEIKRERSQKAAQIQAVTQKMTEVAEKTKILENELEVLLREAALRQKEVALRKRQTQEVTTVCANLRLEKNTHRKRLETAAETERSVKAQVKRMNLDMAAVLDTLSALHNSYEGAVEGRNQAGIQLIDRNDELGLLLEKVKAQEVALQQGVRMTNSKADQIRALKVKLADALREIETCQQCLPKVKQLEGELQRLSDELDDEQWRTRVLENDLTDAANPHRWRKIEHVVVTHALPPLATSRVTDVADSDATDAATGSAPQGGETEQPASVGAAASESTNTAAPAKGPSEEYVRLQARCQDLEARLHAVDTKLREKNLILEEVTDLSERVGGQAEAGREAMLGLAKQVNQYQSGLRQKTRQMMATISELSLFQASSIQLQQEVQRLEQVVIDAEERLKSGQAPYAEAEEEYERAKDSHRRYAEMLQRRRQAQQQEEDLAGAAVVATTAEPRANAYVPDDELGLPRPYGPFAPFKATTQPNVARAAHGPTPATAARAGTPSARFQAANQKPFRSAASSANDTRDASPSQTRLSERGQTPPLTVESTASTGGRP